MPLIGTPVQSIWMRSAGSFTMAGYPRPSATTAPAPMSSRVERNLSGSMCVTSRAAFADHEPLGHAALKRTRRRPHNA